MVALAAAPLTTLAGAIRPRLAGIVGVVMAGLIFGATAWAWSSGGETIIWPWAPSWGLELHFTLDGLAALYALLASGIGLVVLIYATRYIAEHLHHEHRPESDQIRFFGFMLLFLSSMIGMALAQDLLLLFVFYDLTALASYFLIGYDREKADSRESALMALVITAATSVCFLIAALLLQQAFGSFALPEVFARAEESPGPLVSIAAGLIAVAALGKSAQVPLHFWLPRAMAAPTPVSAYLHSAAMVAAGVFLLGRIYPLIELSPLVHAALLWIGLLSMYVAGALALVQDEMKRVLAYSTIAHYGYVTALYGFGGHYGAAGAAFYVLAHALVKSALFLTAGAVTEATGTKKLSEVGGLAAKLPLLAIASGIAAAGLAGLPLTIGFFKDELLFEAALEHGTPYAVAAVFGAALTFAYTWRFWSGIFLGERKSETEPISPLLTWPVLVLVVPALIFGLWTNPPAQLSSAAELAMRGEAEALELAYHFDLRPVNLMALATYATGILLILSRKLWVGLPRGMARLGERIGPERAYLRSVERLGTLATIISRRERRDLAADVASALLPAAVLVGIVIVAFFDPSAYQFGDLRGGNWSVALGLILTVLAALTTVRARGHLTLTLALSAVSYTLAAVYALLAAPDVALVAVLVSTLSSLLFLGLLSLFPRALLRREARERTLPERRWRDPVVAGATGLMTFFVAWGALSRPVPDEGVATELVRLTPSAHADDVVTAILADFRGLDTLGEISVIAIALIGIAALIRHWSTE
ncbi:MAG: DUF4040 domain-containing protein [Oscillochloris sp.]|nr:DUF4040 domain-containing protein [Oscillochloris sp.]